MDSKNLKITIVAVIAIVIVLALAAAAVMTEKSDDKYRVMAVGFVDNLNDGEYVECWSQFSEEYGKTVSPESLEAGWLSITSFTGLMKDFAEITVVHDSDSTIVNVECIFDAYSMILTFVYDSNDKITALVPNVSALEYTIPDGLMDKNIIVGENTEWALNGLITTSKDGTISKTAVVLVHGSGPSDMNETVGPNAVFRDIAWALGENGIDSIRYDKRTFVYGQELASVRDLTVEEETIQDAISAGKILRDSGYEKVYLIGHSMGGMLAPRIVSESGGVFDGFVSLAGSSRTLTDIMTDQIRAAIDDIEDPAIKEATLATLNATIVNIGKLDQMTDEQALSTFIFGVPAYYFKEMNSHDMAEIAHSLDCPMLFLQGSADFQVDPVKDYGKLQTDLEDLNNADFQLFDGLNHMFMVSKDPGKGTAQEYYNVSHVDSAVIGSIASFIKA
jgi:uncharacterized protein